MTAYAFPAASPNLPPFFYSVFYHTTITPLHHTTKGNTMKLKIEYVPIESIKPYAGNAKKHPQEQIDQIKRSIELVGFDDPIAIWKNGEVIEGHGRLIAAQQLGMDKVPIIRLDSLTDEQRRAYTLIHNKLTMNTGFDMEILNLELAEIQEIDMEAFSFLPEFVLGENADESGSQDSDDAPDDFKDFDENMETAHKCPRCGYEWN